MQSNSETCASANTCRCDKDLVECYACQEECSISNCDSQEIYGETRHLCKNCKHDKYGKFYCIICWEPGPGRIVPCSCIPDSHNDDCSEDAIGPICPRCYKNALIKFNVDVEKLKTLCILCWEPRDGDYYDVRPHCTEGPLCESCYKWRSKFNPNKNGCIGCI